MSFSFVFCYEVFVVAFWVLVGSRSLPSLPSLREKSQMNEFKLSPLYVLRFR